jgi:putative chitobiose transport system permease protein
MTQALPAPGSTMGRVSSASQRQRRRRLGVRTSVGLTVLAVLISMVFVLPAVWILIDSFRPADEIATSFAPPSWDLIIPKHFSFDNYVDLITGGFGQALLNSAIVCIGSVVLGLAICSLAAYALGVLRFRGRAVVFGIVVISFMIPFEAIAIPLGQLFSSWGLANTFIGLILPGIGNGLAVFNLRQHFRGIPESFRQAAMIDGAGEFRTYASIYLPMSVPALVNSGLLIFLGQWGSYLWPLLIVNQDSMQLAPIVLAHTFGQHSNDYGQNFAGAILLALVPAVIMFLLQPFFGRLSLGSGER